MAPRNSESSQDWQVLYPEIKMRSAHLLRSREWADCTFQFQCDSAGAGGSKGSLDAHKLILAMASPVFAAMFYGDVGDKEGPVLISDIDMPTFSAMINYIYTDEMDLCGMTTHKAAKLYVAANKYIIIHLEKLCLDYLFQNLNHHNVCYIYEFSCLYSQDELKEKCLELFSMKTVDVLKGRSFRNAQVETLKKIVSMDSLNISSEMDLFKAVLDYADNNKSFIDDQNDEERSKTFDDQQILNDNSCTCGAIALEPSSKRRKTSSSKRRKTARSKRRKTADDLQILNEDSNNCTCGAIALQPSSKRRKEARSYLQGIIQQIRFLSMSAADLAESSEISALLTKDEMLALFVNLSSTKASIPMPDGFSTSRAPRNQLLRPSTLEGDIQFEGTFRHTFHNIRRIIKEEYSSWYNIRGLFWKLKILKYALASHQELPKILGIFLQCQLCEGWTCWASVELRLLSNKTNVKPKALGYRNKFNNDEPDWGYQHFITWRELENPVNGFINEDTITIEVYIKAAAPARDDL